MPKPKPLDRNYWVNDAPGDPAQWIRDHVGYQGNDCIKWPFFCDTGVGRGRINVNKMGGFWAHRIMCLLAHGNPPTEDHQAAHTCGNGHRACMNPRHLEWKTQSENHLDRRKHGTNYNNQTGPVTLKTPEMIAEIRALKGKMPQMAVARKFGISHANVRYWQRTTHQPNFISKDPEKIKRRTAVFSDLT